MRSLLRRLLTFLKSEPAAIGTLLIAGLNIGAAFGLDLTEEQRDAILWGVPLILSVGFGIRSQVTPYWKVKKLMQGPRAAELDPRLFGKRRGRR